MRRANGSRWMGRFWGRRMWRLMGIRFAVDGQSCSRRASISSVRMMIIQNMAGGYQNETKDADITCVIAVKMRVRNRDNIDGGIKAYVWHLVPEFSPNYDFVVNTDLITQAMPVLGGSAAFAVQVGAENQVLVPFMRTPTTISKVTRPSVLRKAFPGTYTMKMTDLPERRLLRFEVK